ncbi:GNAT family N-acetyltransferase [Exiguobacterium acetylicum]|uniref:GNAT family N-acetyltransferase n=1 Tax=Exiguobacterium acetylicum TaxID=41170 RepID=UPI001CA74213|nr:GNAT family N-acetyltransferase [Exiguobacterium acetylicum]QZY86184.1 GNAT family N-acetyltransferase [Exiguobacterium acetylicum]
MIRRATLMDGKALSDLMRRIDRETKYMLYEPEERVLSTEQAEAFIEKFGQAANSDIFVVDVDDQLVGYVLVVGGEPSRIRHRANLVIGLLDAYTGRGLGAGLLEAVDAFAIEAGLIRLELTVRKDNLRAIELYHKFGFNIEGTRIASLFIDGEYVDELAMSKIYTTEES